MKAYQAKDYAQFLSLEKRASQLAPDNPRYIYNTACGEALQGNAHEAVRLLDQLVSWKVDLGAEKDDDFSKIRNSPAWSEFKSQVAALRKPIVHSTTAFTLPDPQLIATGVAVDQKTGDTFIASVRARKILRRSKHGKVSDFIRQGQDGFLAGASLLIDPARRILFASTAAVPFMADYRPEDFGRSGVFAFNLKTGKLLQKALLPPDGKQHFLNALALDKEGNIYVSDSAGATVYRLRRNGKELEVFIPTDVFRSTQGLAFSDDGKTLYVADFSDGIWAVDMATKNRRYLDRPSGVWLAGLDGLTRVPDGFIAVQIAPAVRPERVLHLRLAPSGQKIASVDILEMNHPAYEGPIQGAVAGNAFFYVANTQLDLGDAKTGAFAQDRAKPTVVLRLPVNFSAAHAER
ncbi:MAG TPA: SMP-30/gluconolactonase/LRE family protein [Terriglobales bacterium]|nr:SMP-30/gluconolactonase/LRE family protein [Terriglobales bacterium]